MSTLVTTNLKHGGAASPNIVLNSDGTFNLGDSKVVTPTGSAPSYTCRAWVNFNGTGTVAIRASGNVSSITDNGTGNYTVNFTTAMPDVNYSTQATKGYNSGSATGGRGCEANPSTTSAANVYSYYGGALGDDAFISVSIFR